MFSHPVRLALTSVSRSISRRVTQDSLSVSRARLDDRFSQLDFNVKKTGRVSKNEVQDIFRQVKSQPQSSSTHSLLLLRCCGSLLIEEQPDKRNELVDEIWSTLKSKIDVKLDISHFNALLKVYLENEKNFNPLEFLKEIEAAGLEPNRVTFQRLIHSYCVKGDIEGATKILEFMKSKDISINEGVFNSLIVGYTKIGDIDAAFNTLDIMRKSEIEPSNVTYTTLLSCLAEKVKDDPKAVKYFEDVFSLANDTVFITDRMKLDIVKALLIHCPSSPLIKKITSSFQKTMGFRQDAANVATELLYRGLLDQALEVFFFIPRDGQLASHKVSGGFFVAHMVRAKFPPEKVFEICSRFKREDINLYGFSVAAETAAEPGTDREANRKYVQRFLQESEDPVPRAHYFWPLLVKSQNQSEVLEILREDMQTVCYSSSADSLHETFVDYIWPKASDPEHLMQECRMIGFSAPVLLSSYIIYLLESCNYSKAIALLRDQKYLNTRLVQNPLIRSLGKAAAVEGSGGEIVTLLKELHLRNTDNDVPDRTGLFIEEFVRHRGHLREANGKNVLNIMLRRMAEYNLSVSDKYKERLSKLPLTQRQLDIINSMTGTYRPTPVTVDGDAELLPTGIDQLEDHLKELQSKNMNTRGCVRKLILEYCRRTGAQMANFLSNEGEEDEASADSRQEAEKFPYYVKRVKELIQMLGNDTTLYSDGMKASLFEFYATCGDLDSAMSVRNEISQSFIIDDFKVMNVARWFIRAGKVEEGINLLKEELEKPGRREHQSAFKPEKRQRDPHAANIFRVVNEAAEKTKDPAVVDEILNLCLQFRGMKPTNVMLGPKVRVHLLRNDLDAAIDEFASITALYKQTPWMGEIMRQLIEKEETAKLQMITDLAIAIHGEPNVLGDLAFAFLKAGKTKQATKVFSTIGLRGNMWKIRMYTQRMIQEKDIECLERTVFVTKDIPDVNRDEVYQHLIRGYRAVNDPQKALNTWTMMQEEGVIASQETLALLGSFLKESNMPVPFEVPHFQQETLSLQSKQTSRGQQPSIQASIVAEVVREENPMKAYQKRNQLLSEGKLLSLTQECILMDKLLAEGHVDEAYHIADQLTKEGKYPNPKTFRNLFASLGKQGRVDLISQIQPRLPAEFVNQASYTNALADAYLQAGKEEILLRDILPSLKPIPLFAIRQIMKNKPSLEKEVMSMAKKFVDTDNYCLPQNMVWIHFMTEKRYSEAAALLQSTARLRNQIMYTSILNEIKDNQDVEMADELLKQLNKTNLSPRSLGIVVSAKIDVLVDKDEPEEAERILIDLIENPSPRTNEATGERIPPIQLTDINRMALIRLYHKLSEKLGREPKFTIPDKESFKTERNSVRSENNETTTSGIQMGEKTILTN